eukprot:Skav221551  [mRNA]  locus=scaffold1376:58815:62530:+ [translate_table: standard]
MCLDDHRLKMLSINIRQRHLQAWASLALLHPAHRCRGRRRRRGRGGADQAVDQRQGPAAVILPQPQLRGQEVATELTLLWMTRLGQQD